jgi:biopolymer transport protein ExbD/biopolymer transport protein TolR
MAMQTGGGGSYVADINVTPMVDVMLVLLIIFMVITPMLQSGVSVALPTSTYPDRDDDINKESSVVIAIPEEGKFYINKDPVGSLADIPQRIANMMKNKTSGDQIVYIKSGKLVKYGTVVSVVDAVREAGYDRIGLVSEREKEEGEGGEGGGDK